MGKTLSTRHTNHWTSSAKSNVRASVREFCFYTKDYQKDEVVTCLPMHYTIL